MINKINKKEKLIFRKILPVVNVISFVALFVDFSVAGGWSISNGSSNTKN